MFLRCIFVSFVPFVMKVGDQARRYTEAKTAVVFVDRTAIGNISRCSARVTVSASVFIRTQPVSSSTLT